MDIRKKLKAQKKALRKRSKEEKNPMICTEYYPKENGTGKTTS
jgi:hypothetical protein